MSHMPASRARRLLKFKPTRFRIYPEERTGFYFEVWIYPERTMMIQHIARLRGTDRLDVDALAYTHPLTVKRLIGDVLIWGKSLDKWTVSHELFHAVAWWAHRKRLDPAKCLSWKGWKTQRGIATHERMAEAMGKMTAEFWRRVRSWS